MRDPKICELCGASPCGMRSADYCELGSRYVRLITWFKAYAEERINFRAEMVRKRGIPDLSRMRAIEAEIEQVIEDWGLLDEKKNT